VQVQYQQQHVINTRQLSYHIISNYCTTPISVLRSFTESVVEIYWLKVSIRFRFEIAIDNSNNNKINIVNNNNDAV